jgi:hypothetical protein
MHAVAAPLTDSGHLSRFSRGSREPRDGQENCWAFLRHSQISSRYRGAPREIAHNAQEVASGTPEVSGNITSVNRAATETGEAAQHVLAAASQLTGQAEQLTSELERYLAAVSAA